VVFVGSNFFRGVSFFFNGKFFLVFLNSVM